MIGYLVRFGWRALRHPRIAWLGFCEGHGDLGLTFGDPYTSRSVAYDVGRTIRRRDARA